MRHVKTVLFVSMLLTSAGCGAKKISFQGEGEKRKDDKRHVQGLSIGEGGDTTANEGLPTETPEAIETVADVQDLPESATAPDAQIDLCKLPASSYQLLGWGAPTGQGGQEAQEVIKACEFDTKYATCAFGIDPTTNTPSVLGCEEYAGPDTLNHARCIEEAAVRTQSNRDKDIAQYQCIRSNIFAEGTGEPDDVIGPAIEPSDRTPVATTNAAQ